MSRVRSQTLLRLLNVFYSLNEEEFKLLCCELIFLLIYFLYEERKYFKKADRNEYCLKIECLLLNLEC